MADARALTIQSGQMQELAIADSLLLSGIEIPDNTASALLVAEGANGYLDITTTDANELVTVGNAITNPGLRVAGSGLATFDSQAIQLTEQAGDPGAVPSNAVNIYSKDVATVSEMFVQDSAGNVIQVTSGGSVNVGTGTDNISWNINQNGIAASNDDPFLILTGGDGGAELIVTTLLQDSSADELFLTTALSTAPSGESDRGTVLTLGPSATVPLTTSQVASRLVLHNHRTGRPVGEFDVGFIGFKTNNNAFQVHPEDVTAVGATGVALNAEAGYGAVAQGATPGGTGGAGFFLAGFGGAGTAGLAGGPGGNCIVSSGDGGDDFGGGGDDSGDLILNTGNPTGAGVAGNVELGFQASNIFVGSGSTLIGLFLQDNQAQAYRVVQGANLFMNFATTNGSEAITVGNATATAPTIEITTRNATAASYVVQHAAGDDLFSWNTSTYALSVQNATDNGATDFLGSGNITVAAVARIFGADGDTVLGGTAMSGTERLRVVGDCRVEGKLTVTGSIDPTDVQLSGGTALHFGSADGSTAALSGANEGRLRYNDTTGTWQVSTQGGAYASLSTGGTPGGADTQIQYNNAGVFGGAASATFDGTNITTTNALFTDGGIDRSAAATLLIGTTNASAITIGSPGILTTLDCDISVTGNETITGTSTFTDSATFNGNVTFGNAATDTLQYGATDAVGSRIGPAVSPNMHFVKEVNHVIDVDASTTNTTDGGTLSIASGDGTVASGAGNNAGNGGSLNTSPGGGGASIGTDNAGIGGSHNITTGFGGAGSATNVGGNSGNLSIDVGAPGASGGAGAGTPGTMSFGETNATSIAIGNTATQTITLDGTVSVTIPDDSAGALTISEGATDYVQIVTTNGSESMILGTTATQTITLDATVSVTIPDNSAGALVIAQGAVDYIRIVTTNGGESIEYGNASTTPLHNFLGGSVTVEGPALLLTEQAGDPTTGANEGGLYTKDDGGVTQLFYRADSDGTVYQLTPPASGGDATNVVTNKTASENIAAGAPVNIFNSGGVPRIREADANDAARQRTIGLAAAAIVSAAAGDVVTQGEVPVPDAQWDVLPAVGDVGSPVYLSTTVGNLTITAPSGAVTVVDMGTVSTGGTGAVTVLVNVKMPVKTI